MKRHEITRPDTKGPQVETDLTNPEAPFVPPETYNIIDEAFKEFQGNAFEVVNKSLQKVLEGMLESEKTEPQYQQKVKDLILAFEQRRRNFNNFDYSVPKEMKLIADQIGTEMFEFIEEWNNKKLVVLPKFSWTNEEHVSSLVIKVSKRMRDFRPDIVSNVGEMRADRFGRKLTERVRRFFKKIKMRQ